MSVKALKSVPFELPFLKGAYKDCSLSFILKERPELGPLLEALIPLMEEKRFLSIDYFEQEFSKGNLKTCRNLSFHVDGENNNYLIWSKGGPRTLFLKEPQIVEGQSLRAKNDYLRDKTFKGLFFEIPEETPVLYTSDDPHAGRIAKPNDKRWFLRLCQSDYLKPKNIKK